MRGAKANLALDTAGSISRKESTSTPSGPLRRCGCYACSGCARIRGGGDDRQRHRSDMRLDTLLKKEGVDTLDQLIKKGKG